MGFSFNALTCNLDLVGSSSGNVVGPASGATDNAVARFDGTTGLALQDSSVIINDSGDIDTPGDVTAQNIEAVDQLTADNLVVTTDAEVIGDLYVSETGNRALTTDVSGIVTASVTTDTELAYLSGVTSAVQTQIDAKIPLTQKGAANGVATLDASNLIPIIQIPPSALERLIIVADQTARFALTTATAQNGDTVKQTDTNVMYFVIDDTNLGNSAGYAIYNAGTAASVAWSGITGVPAPVTALLGTNTGDVTLTVAGASPNTSGASLSGQVLTLQPADGTNPGLVTAGAQTIGGAKTFSSTISASNLSGTNSGDISLGTVGASPNGSAASLAGQVLTIQPADGTNPGVLTSGAQTIGGAKTFSGAISASNLSGTNTGDQTITLTGVVTGSGTGSFATTIAANQVTNSMLAQSATLTLKGNNTGGTANVADLTAAQVRTLLGIVSGSPGDIGETSFSAVDNQASAANVTGLAFSNAAVRGFEVVLTLFLNATTPKYATYKLLGIQKASTWEMDQSFVGDGLTAGIVFSITTAGQVQYTSTAAAGFVSNTMKFRAVTTSV